MRVNRDLLELWALLAKASPNPKETWWNCYHQARLKGYRIEREREKLVRTDTTFTLIHCMELDI